MFIDSLRAARETLGARNADGDALFNVAHTLIGECQNAPKNAHTLLAARIGSCAVVAARIASGYELHLSQWGEATVTERYGEADADAAASRAILFLAYGRGGE